MNPGKYQRATFVPIVAVAIAAGWGWAICGPMAIPAEVPGGSSRVRPAKGTFRRSWHDLLWQTGAGGVDRPCASVLG
jgi:hypothetical protein